MVGEGPYPALGQPGERIGVDPAVAELGEKAGDGLGGVWVPMTSPSSAAAMAYWATMCWRTLMCPARGPRSRGTESAVPPRTTDQGSIAGRLDVDGEDVIGFGGVEDQSGVVLVPLLSVGQAHGWATRSTASVSLPRPRRSFTARLPGPATGVRHTLCPSFPRLFSEAAAALSASRRSGSDHASGSSQTKACAPGTVTSSPSGARRARSRT